MSEEILDDGPVVEQNNAVKITDDKAVYSFTNTNPEELGVKVRDFLLKQGYKLEKGSPTAGVYGKGSKALRILFGAFVKRFTWGVKVMADGENTILLFTKDEKGNWGGLIGISQVKKEYKRITQLLNQYHIKHHS